MLWVGGHCYRLRPAPRRGRAQPIPQGDGKGARLTPRVSFRPLPTPVPRGCRLPVLFLRARPSEQGVPGPWSGRSRRWTASCPPVRYLPRPSGAHRRPPPARRERGGREGGGREPGRGSAGGGRCYSGQPPLPSPGGGLRAVPGSRSREGVHPGTGNGAGFRRLPLSSPCVLGWS